MAGDQPQICMDPKQVSFMYSYPNYIPLNAPAIRHIMECLDPLKYDRVYGAFFIRGKGIVPTQGKEVVRRSADRYCGRSRANRTRRRHGPGPRENEGRSCRLREHRHRSHCTGLHPRATFRRVALPDLQAGSWQSRCKRRRVRSQSLG